MHKLRDALARQLAARNIHYGWAMVAVAFLYSVFSSSAPLARFGSKMSSALHKSLRWVGLFFAPHQTWRLIWILS